MKLIDCIAPAPARVAFGLARGAAAAPAAHFASRTEIAATAVGSAGPDYLRTAGHGVSGDGGQALYRRAGAEPAHGFKVRSADGTWWEGVPEPEGVNVKAFGAVGNGIADDAAAIQAAIDFAMTSTRGGAVIFPFAGGEVYAIASGLAIDPARVGGNTVNHVWLKGTGMPVRFTQGAVKKNRLMWIGAGGAAMLTLVDPLDHKISDIALDGNLIAEQCVHQVNSRGGWGGVHWQNVAFERSAGANFRFSGAVDGGRNLFDGCGFNLKRAPTGDGDRDCLVLYDGADNVNDQFRNCEMVWTLAGAPVGTAVRIADGSPQVHVSGGFLKADTAIHQTTGPGAAQVSVMDTYVEGANFYRADKQIDSRQDFVNVRHSGGANGTGRFIDIKGNNNGKVLHVSGGYTRADIEILDRDDFPIVFDGFERRGGTLTLPGVNGARLNAVEIGRGGDVAASVGMVAASGFAVRLPQVQTTPNLYPNLARGTVAHASRAGGQALTVRNPANVTAVEDDGAVLTIVVEATGAGSVAVTWESAYRFANAAPPASVTGDARTIVRFLNMGGTWYEIGRSENVG